MPLRPRGRRLIRGAARTAAVAGTAAVVGGGRVHHHQQQKWADEQYDQQMAARQATAQAAPNLQSTGDDMIEELEKLAALHDAGALTDKEFTTAKAELLGT